MTRVTAETRAEILADLDIATNYVGGLYNGLPGVIEQRLIKAVLDTRQAFADLDDADKRIAELEKHADMAGFGHLSSTIGALNLRLSELEAENTRLRARPIAEALTEEAKASLDRLRKLADELTEADFQQATVQHIVGAVQAYAVGMQSLARIATLEAQLAERTKERDAALGTADDVYARWNEAQVRLTATNEFNDDRIKQMNDHMEFLEKTASDVRAAALEEAAKVAAGYNTNKHGKRASVIGAWIAAAIRALKPKGEPSQ